MHSATTVLCALSLHDALPISFDPSGEKEALETPSYGLGITYEGADRKSTRLNSSHVEISYAVFCLKKKISVGTRSTSGTSPSSPATSATSHRPSTARRRGAVC